MTRPFTRHAPTRAGAAGLLLVLALLLAGCELPAVGEEPEPVTSLCPQVASVETRRPALISMFVKVSTCEGAPVTRLDIDDFTIFEDGNPISRSESRPDIFPVEQEFRTATVLLLDLSGSVVSTGALPELKEAAKGFTETVLASRSDIPNDVAVYWFDGSEGVKELVSFTDDATRLLNGIDSLAESTPQDDSTNLNGAVVGGVEVLEREQQRLRDEGVPFTLGSLVIFTDGTDQASRVDETAALRAVRSAQGALIQTVGLGGEINEGVLAQIGRDGFEFARNTAEIAAAFERAGDRIRRESNSFYLVRYCSPRRAGEHSLRVEVATGGASASFEETFSADGFGPGCDPADASGELLSRVANDTAASGQQTGDVQARRTFGFLCLQNRTDRDLPYGFSWGDGDWRESLILAGAERLHLWEFAPDAGPPPAFRIRFDPEDGDSEPVMYLLEQTQSQEPSCQAAPRYVFERDERDRLDLFLLTSGG